MSKGLVSLMVGIVALIASLLSAASPVVFVIAVLAAIVGAVMGILCLARKEQDKVLGIIGLCLSGLAILLVVVMVFVAVGNVMAQRSLITG